MSQQVSEALSIMEETESFKKDSDSFKKRMEERARLEALATAAAAAEKGDVAQCAGGSVLEAAKSAAQAATDTASSASAIARRRVLEAGPEVVTAAAAPAAEVNARAVPVASAGDGCEQGPCALELE